MSVDNKYTFEIIGTDKTKQMFRSLAAGVRQTVNVAGTLGAGVAAGLAVMVNRSIEANTELTRLGHTVGVNSKTMSEWTHAAQTVNVEGDKMADIFKDVQDKIGDFATTGGGGAADVFEKLNLDVREFVGLSADQQLIKIAAGLESVGSQSEKIFFLESLAGDASKLMPLLDDNAAGLREMQEEAQALGVSISDVDAAKMEAAKRSMERVNAAMTGVSNKLTVQLSPIIESLAKKFVGAATEGDRLSAAVKKGFEVGAKVAGVLADGVRGIQIVFKGLEVITRGLTVAMTAGFGKIVKMANEGVRNAIIDGIFFPLRTVLGLLAKVSDVAVEVLADVNELAKKVKESAAEGFEGLATAQFNAFSAAQSELQNLLTSELPSKLIANNIERIMDEADVIATTRAAEIKRKLDAGVSGTDAPADQADQAAARDQARLAARLQRLDEHFLTELEKIQAKLQSELQLIQEGEDAKLLAEDEANAKRLRSQQKFETAKTKLMKAQEANRASLAKAGMSVLEIFANSGSKKLFGVQKAAALAQAAVSLPAAIIDSFKNAGGYPWGLVPAAAMAATGAAQIQSIKGTNIGGGGAVASVSGAGGTASSQVQSINSPLVGSRFPDSANTDSRLPTEIHFHVAGALVHERELGEFLASNLRDLVDADVIIIPPDSAQAQEIRDGGLA